MIGEVLLMSGLGASAVGIGYLLHHGVQERKTREAKRRDEESRFRAALLHELARKRSTSFRFPEFIAKCEVSNDLANRVAEGIYAGFYRKVVADGAITGEEKAKVSWLSRALELGTEQIGRAEQRAKEETYGQAVDSVVADGTITREEAASLELLRRGLGLSKQEAFRLTGEVSRSNYLATFRRIVRDGVVTAEERQELLRCQQALALSDVEASFAIRTEALALYREWFARVIQDGIITDEEERHLAWLQEWAGLQHSDVAEFHARMKVVKRLAAYRDGNLPPVKTRKILEVGETCHWDRPCTLIYETRTRSTASSGDLVVTSKNVFFVSPTKSLSYKPSKILDIIKYSDALEIKVNARQGSGRYFVSEPEELEAVLTGVVRKHKFLLSESYSSARTRHVPDDIKREVWDRDGGRCVRCGASDYLEFDHVIAYTRGGASTVNNVQVLCRRCNLLKSDRI